MYLCNIQIHLGEFISELVVRPEKSNLGSAGVIASDVDYQTRTLSFSSRLDLETHAKFDKKSADLLIYTAIFYMIYS